MGAACKEAGVCREKMRRWCREGIVRARQIPAGQRMDWQIDASSLESIGQGVHGKALAILRGMRV